MVVLEQAGANSFVSVFLGEPGEADLAEGRVPATRWGCLELDGVFQVRGVRTTQSADLTPVPLVAFQELQPCSGLGAWLGLKKWVDVTVAPSIGLKTESSSVEKPEDLQFTALKAP